MTNAERRATYVRLLHMLDERRALPWWAWVRRAALTRHMHTLADTALL